ncbi:hypothetical protein O181_068003 [Austropuccinia psidii MF-1]|uniref:Reverse transcriptase/retrotransposon-derived protein RNase H-like domain-containing protein n=1 Tax=Austropuccinia psidii MF-1 TaxID=1389203 RepID=A0A9Q3EUG3_9BASI|nr:hypothetical protein [Austropuccinia psidii MF-1]
MDIIYEVLDINSNLPQVGTSYTNLTNVQDATLYRVKPAKGMGYTAGKSSISIVMVDNQEAKVNLDTGAYCTGVECVRIRVEFLTSLAKKDRYFTIGDNKRQTFGLLSNKKQITAIKNHETSPAKRLFISEQLKEAEFNPDLTEKMKEKLIDLSFKYKNDFATDKEPLGAIIVHEVDIILNVEMPYLPLLRRPAYPASQRARDALEVHIQEFLDLGVLRKVGHNEQVEATTPVIITWNNGKSRIVGVFRALNTYAIPDRYPIPRIHETLTQLSQAKFITAMDALKGLHQTFLTDNSKRLLRRIVHCGIFEYLRAPFGIKNAPSHYQRMINTIFPENLSEG